MEKTSVVCPHCGQRIGDTWAVDGGRYCVSCAARMALPAPGLADRRVEMLIPMPCGLTGHHYIELAAGFMICEECHKEQSRADDICLICNSDGVFPVRLRDESGMAVAGRLCPPCAEDFRHQGVIAGWVLEWAAA